MFNFTTKNRKKYWTDRKIDWKHSYLDGVDEVTGEPIWNHPHREIIVSALRSFNWVSLWEVGCGPGGNLVKITKSFQGKQLGGSDVNEDAIEVAKQTFTGGKFNVESAEDLLLSDKAVDVMLSDATLIYIGPGKIKSTIKELVRVTRNAIVLCEFHSTNPFARLWLRLKTGYNAYDYEKLLEEAGCYDIQKVKIPERMWPGFPWNIWGYVLVAKVT